MLSAETWTMKAAMNAVKVPAFWSPATICNPVQTYCPIWTVLPAECHDQFWILSVLHIVLLPAVPHNVLQVCLRKCFRICERSQGRKLPGVVLYRGALLQFHAHLARWPLLRRHHAGDLCTATQVTVSERAEV